MTTAFLEFDEQLRRQSRRHNASQQWQQINGMGEQQLREKLTVVEVAERESDNLSALLADYRHQIDAATAKHQKTTAPLQNELASEKTTTARRVEARAAVQAANAELEQTITPLNTAIAAAEEELAIARATASGRLPIENAWIGCAPDSDLLRIKALNKSIELAENSILFNLRKKLEQADAELAGARAQQKKMRDQNPRRFNLTAVLTDELERNAKFLHAVTGIVAGWTRQANDELKAIRARRLAELYD